MEKLVPNPRYEELERTLALVRARGRRLQAALDPAFDAFTSQAVWVGPTARAFRDGLAHHRNLLKTAIDDVIADLEAQLRGTRREVPPSMLSNG